MARKLPEAVYPAGLLEFVNDARRGTKPRLRIVRVAWPDTGADVLRMVQECSRDNGQTWEAWRALTTRGGVEPGAAFTEGPLAAVPDGVLSRIRITLLTSLRLAVDLDEINPGVR